MDILNCIQPNCIQMITKFIVNKNAVCLTCLLQVILCEELEESLLAQSFG